MKFYHNSSFRLILGCFLIVVVSILPLFLFAYFGSELLFVGLILSIGLGLAGVVAMLVVHYKITTLPLRNIVRSTQRITKGEYVKREQKFKDNDVTALMYALNNTAYEFENIEKMRKSFISNASHELRSPLTSIQGFLQAIIDGTIGAEDMDKYLNIIFRETKRLSSLINSMLDLSRLESGKNPLVPIRFDLSATIRQIAERFEPNLLKKDSQLETDFCREFLYVFADKEKVIQVLINLIDNAIKYSPSKSRIVVNTRLNGKKVYISIKDSGFGISKKDQTLIWDRFYMADKAHTPTKTKGTGLGLSIVKKIIDDHKETIWVESTKGAGSTFIFSLAVFDQSKHKTEYDLGVKTNTPAQPPV